MSDEGADKPTRALFGLLKFLQFLTNFSLSISNKKTLVRIAISSSILPIPALLEANLVALGSMCGSRYCSFNSVGIDGDKAVLQMVS